MKESYYFSHDYHSRDDRKLINVRIKHGMKGIGIFWCIVEMLYEEGGYLPLKYENFVYQLQSDQSEIKSIIHDFELFENDGIIFWSNSVIRRLELREKKSEKARQSSNIRWKKPGTNANVFHSNKDCNAINEIKGNKSKEKESINENQIEIKEKREQERVVRENPDTILDAEKITDVLNQKKKRARACESEPELESKSENPVGLDLEYEQDHDIKIEPFGKKQDISKTSERQDDPNIDEQSITYIDSSDW